MPRPPDAVHDAGTVAVWIESPNIVMTQVRSPHYTVAQAKTFVGPIMTAVRLRLQARRYIWVSDSRRLETYEPGARQILIEWCTENRAFLERVVLIIGKGHAVVLAGAQFASVVAALVGIQMSVETSPLALSRYGVPDLFSE
jgi:hypothetical protein